MMYDLKVPSTTRNFAVKFYRNFYLLFVTEIVVICKSPLESTPTLLSTFSKTVSEFILSLFFL